MNAYNGRDAELLKQLDDIKQLKEERRKVRRQFQRLVAEIESSDDDEQRISAQIKANSLVDYENELFDLIKSEVVKFNALLHK